MRPKLRTIKAVADAASEAAHANLRSFRNLLMTVAAVATATAIAMAIAHSADHGILAICQAGPHGCRGRADVGEIGLAGALGGTVDAVFALARSTASASSYDLPLVQALLRIPTGALVGLLGVLFIQNDVLGAFTSQNASGLIAYAALFGYAQEPVLRAIDRRGDQVLDDARTKNDPVRTPSNR